MYEFQYWLSLIVCNLITPKVIEKVVIEEKIVKDTRGFMPDDIRSLEADIDMKPFKVGDAIESVAYKQGQIDLLTHIKQKFIGRAL